MIQSQTRHQPNQSNITLPSEPVTGSLVLMTADTLLLTMSDIVAESLRYLLARLKSRDEFPSKVALTSPLRREGVTYISRALGAVMANDFPETICVAELNWSHPSALPVSNEVGKGVAGFVHGECSLEEAIVPTNYPNLSLLPPGQLSSLERPILVNSQKLADAIDEIAYHFDYLLLDVPAVLATSEVIPLIALADASLLVVRHGSATFDRLAEAIDDISHQPLLGAVMNQVELATPKWMLKYMPGA